MLITVTDTFFLLFCAALRKPVIALYLKIKSDASEDDGDNDEDERICRQRSMLSHAFI